MANREWGAMGTNYLRALFAQMCIRDRYDITQHPNYKYLSDSNPKYAFDIEKFLSTRMPVKPGEAFIHYEISPEELAQEYEGTEK